MYLVDFLKTEYKLSTCSDEHNEWSKNDKTLKLDSDIKQTSAWLLKNNLNVSTGALWPFFFSTKH